MEVLKTRFRSAISPATRVFKGLHPNVLTLIGFLITVLAALFYGSGIFWIGGFVLLIGGLFDVLDGEVAKLTGRVSKFGAFLDSCFDRYSDFAVLFGMLWWYINTDSYRWGYGGILNLASILVMLTILGSYMVSYTRARAEGLGVECKVGFGERAFRVPVIVIGSLFGPRIFVGFLWLLVCLTNLTAFYRIYWVYKNRGGIDG